MAKDTRTLTLKILADVDKLNQQLNKGEQDVSSFGASIEKFGKAAAAAFVAAAAAAAAYAGKLAVDGVKAAIEDEAAQKRLAQALTAATGATNTQIKATEDFISRMQLATGVADTDLRNALGRLALSTNSVTKAQDLLSLALDISKARGIPLENVANALGKAYDGQTTALARLGLGFSSAEIKGKSFADVQDMLTKSFGGAAAVAAESYQGRIDRLKQAFAEFQENIGYKLLPIIETLMNYIIQNVIPYWQKFANVFEPVGAAIERNKESFAAFGKLILEYVVPILGGAFVGALTLIGKIAGGVIDVIGKIAGAIVSVVNGAIGAINALIKAYNAIPLLPNIPTINGISAPTFSVPKVNLSTGTSSSSFTGSSSSSSTTISGTNKSGGVDVKELPPTLIEQVTAANVMKKAGAGIFDPGRFRMGEEANRPVVNNTINIGVAGDPEGAARAIVDVLNSSYTRGSGGAGTLYAV